MSKHIVYVVDIDECKDALHDCHSQATCANTKGSFICTCNVGWSGSGQECSGRFIHDLFYSILVYN